MWEEKWWVVVGLKPEDIRRGLRVRSCALTIRAQG